MAALDPPAAAIIIRRTGGAPMAIKRLVKLGGAAITHKQTLETLNEQVLRDTSQMLGDVASPRAYAEEEVGPAGCGAAGGTVIVHGAGSFGHHQATEGRVASGGLQRSSVRQGLIKTRLSVQKLHLHVLEALISAGIEAVGLSPFGTWETSDRQLAAGWTEDVSAALRNGFVPVLHGDCVFDRTLGCTILSGDLIMSHLAQTLKPEVVIFLTNVDGVYSRPPDQPGARLLRTIRVTEGGSWTAGNGETVEMSNDSLDTTGGIEKKIEEAACIARHGGPPVVIARAGTEDARAVLALGVAALGAAGQEMLQRPVRATLVTGQC